MVTVTNNQRTQDHDPTKPSTGAGCLHALPPPPFSPPRLPPPHHARTNAHTSDRIHAHERTHTARTRWLDLPLVPSGQSLAHTRPRRPTSGCWLTPVLSRTPDYSAQTRATRTAATQMGKLQFTWEWITGIPYSTFLPTPSLSLPFHPLPVSLYLLIYCMTLFPWLSIFLSFERSGGNSISSCYGAIIENRCYDNGDSYNMLKNIHSRMTVRI